MVWRSSSFFFCFNVWLPIYIYIFKILSYLCTYHFELHGITFQSKKLNLHCKSKHVSMLIWPFDIDNLSRCHSTQLFPKAADIMWQGCRCGHPVILSSCCPKPHIYIPPTEIGITIILRKQHNPRDEVPGSALHRGGSVRWAQITYTFN